MNLKTISLNLTVASMLAAAAQAVLQPASARHVAPVVPTTGTGLAVTSAFSNGAVVPKQFTADGVDHSPALRWSKAPFGTKSIAVICFDPDAPRGTWYHWLIYNLSGATTGLPEGVPRQPSLSGGAMQGINDFNRVGYNGPAPPPGQKHRYIYRVMALNEQLALKPGAAKDAVLRAIEGHVVAQGDVQGVYSR